MDGDMLFVVAEYGETAQKKLAMCFRALQDAGFTGRQTPNIPYHISIASYPAALKPSLLKSVEQAAEDRASFEISLSHIGLFGLEVLFAAPVPNEQLLELHRLFPEQYGQTYDWVPHTTLLMDDASEIQRAIPIAAQRFVPFFARVEALSIYQVPHVERLGSFRLKEEGLR